MKRSWFGLLGLFGLLSVAEDNHDTDLMPENRMSCVLAKD